MKLFHVVHTGAAIKHYIDVLRFIQGNKSYGIDVSIVNLGYFIEKGIPLKTDVLSYQTFPDESHIGKFNRKNISKADDIFNAFKGHKIIVDCHDCGDKDAFSRFYNTKEFPRVKVCPTDWFLKNYNVILLSTTYIQPGSIPDKYNRDIEISYKFGGRERGFYGHTIRETVIDYMEKYYADRSEGGWVHRIEAYQEYLGRTLIAIGAPGWGRYNGTYWLAMKVGALLFAHRSFEDIHFLPHADLIPDEDYVSYDLFNFRIKLDRILNDREEIDRIRNNGSNKFDIGVDYKKSADQLVEYLRRNVK